MRLWIENSGASTDEIEAGRNAAEALLRERGITPEQAHAASLSMAKEEPFEVEHYRAWDDAEGVALAVTFSGWARWPDGACLAPAS